jgi:hypothetical protein
VCWKRLQRKNVVNVPKLNVEEARDVVKEVENY